MQRVEVPERRRRLHLRRDVTRLQSVDLVESDHDRDVEVEDAARDVPVTGADPLAGADDEHDRVEIVRDRLLDTFLHPFRERVDGTLPAGKVDEHELRVVARPHAAYSMARRVRDT